MSDFAKREEQLRRMNAELEAKRLSTLQNAENAVRDHHDNLSNIRTSQLDLGDDDTPEHPRSEWLANSSLSSPLRAPQWGLTASPTPSGSPKPKPASPTPSAQQLPHRTNRPLFSIDPSADTAPSRGRPVFALATDNAASQLANAGAPVSESPVAATSHRSRPSFALDIETSTDQPLEFIPSPSPVASPMARIASPSPIAASRPALVTEQDEAVADLGEDAANRYVNAKLRVVQEELEMALKETQAKEAQVRRLNEQLKTATDEVTKLQKREKAQSSSTERAQRQANELQVKKDALEKKVISLGKEMDGMQGKSKTFDKESQQKDIRLNRALEEIERLKTQLKDAQTSVRSTGDNARKGNEQLIADNKRLEKQKAELIVAFKKQLKLIDVLRRQKMHVEAARLLSFTEEEFTKTLELGDR